MDPRLQAFERLLNIMDELREKCPWDRKQTFSSLRILTIEETYELADAILDNDLAGIEEEIGDLLLHMVFYAKLGMEKGAFDITSALERICDKLVERHPHIYGDVDVDNEQDVKQNWETIKLRSGKTSILQGVPRSLPALVKAYRLQDKAAHVGFDWEEKEQVWNKLEEELTELRDAMNEQDEDHIQDELGDVLFTIINLARHHNIDPEAALESVNKKFKSRFEFIEKNAGKPVQKLKLEEMERLWQDAKKQKQF